MERDSRKMKGVETNMAKSGNNFWLSGQYTDSHVADSYGVKLRKMMQPHVVYVPYARVNMERMALKKL